MKKLLKFLGKLERSSISYHLEHNREDALMVLIAVPGERWEVEFFSDGHIEVETFQSSSEGIQGKKALKRLFKEFFH